MTAAEDAQTELSKAAAMLQVECKRLNCDDDEGKAGVKYVLYLLITAIRVHG